MKKNNKDSNAQNTISVANTYFLNSGSVTPPLGTTPQNNSPLLDLEPAKSSKIKSYEHLSLEVWRKKYSSLFKKNIRRKQHYLMLRKKIENKII